MPIDSGRIGNFKGTFWHPAFEMTLENATQVDRCHKGYYEGDYC